MDDRRTLPIPAEHRELVVRVRGQPVPRTQHLLAVTIVKAVNRVSSAQLTWQDGAASDGRFPLSDGNLFVPGADVEVLAGTSDNPVSLFRGVVVRQSIKLRGHAGSRLVVDCRHKAVKLTVGRKSACYLDKTDADIVSGMLDAAGLDKDVEATSVKHAQVVQFRATDWDFLVTRAEANGRHVFTNDDKVVVKAPAVSGGARFSLQFGATLLELDAEVDARNQYHGVKGVTWDAAQQALVEHDAADPGIAGPGNLSSDDLASVAALQALRLDHAALPDDEAQAWADAGWIKSRLSKVSGRARCEGIATVNPGDIVSMAGVGERFNGDVYVTGVRHDSDPASGWKTHVQFGSVARWFAEEHDVVAPPAGALVPAASGLQVAVVTSNEDPDGEHRVRVRLPMVEADGDGIWARVAALDAGDDRGFFVRPELGDEVVVGFLDSDPRRAVLLGMLNSSAKAAPLKGSDDNHEKVFQTRSKIRLYFNDDKKEVRVETPGGNKLTLSDDEQGMKFEDQHGNVIEMNADGVRIESAKALKLKGNADVEVESGTGLTAKGGTELKLEGASAAELSSSGTTTIKGSLVKIN